MPDQAIPARRPPSSRGLKRLGTIAVVLAAVVVLVGVAARVRNYFELKHAAHEQSVPTVALAKVKPSGEAALTLPGTVQAFNSAALHARTNGYLKRWYVDIGAPVKAGQLLAEIDTPDLDQQVLQARADLATARSNEALARTTSDRWAALLKEDAVSRQDAEERAGALAARTSAVNSARANLDRLRALEGFKRIVAPFDGVVTTRNTDIGALVGAGGSPDAALFTVADLRRLRIYVNVPQAYSAQLKTGLTADLSAPEHPGKTFKAVLVNQSGAINPQSGNMLVQLQIDNADGRLKPGGYVQVKFRLPTPAEQVSVPATALLYRGDGPVVVVNGPDNHVIVRPVTIVRDLGTDVVIGSGLGAHERVIDNPPEGLQTGDPVRVAGAPAKKRG